MQKSPVVLRRAERPFHFFNRLSLTVATGLKARNAAELLDGLKSVPDSVLYTHTYRFLQYYQFLVPEPSNDFALWAKEALQDEPLSEALLAVDTIGHSTIGDLRTSLVAAVERHLRKDLPSRNAPDGREFHFVHSVRFSIPTAFEARDLSEFAETLKHVSFSSLYLHVFEARLRPPLGVNDFSLWLEGELGEKQLAKRIAQADPYNQTLDALRSQIVKMIEERLKEEGHG